MLYIIKHTGHLLDTTITSATSAEFFGQTSKGIFLKSQTNKIIFVTNIQSKGPFTLNIESPNKPLPHCTKKTTIRFFQNQIKFQNPSFEIDLSKAKIWNPTEISYITPKTNLIKNCKNAFSILESNSKNNLLSYAKTLFNSSSKSENNLVLSFNQLNHVKQSIELNSEENLLQSLINCIGFGNGLTPSGDDFICGIILAETILKNKPFTSKFKETLINSALQRTTLISANLIEAAFKKSADERILLALKEICADEITNIGAIKNLLTWGNSSGLDTLTGIILSVMT